jgi:hypothetical protein
MGMLESAHGEERFDGRTLRQQRFSEVELVRSELRARRGCPRITGD